MQGVKESHAKLRGTFKVRNRQHLRIEQLDGLPVRNLPDKALDGLCVHGVRRVRLFRQPVEDLRGDEPAVENTVYIQRVSFSSKGDISFLSTGAS